MRSYLKSVVAFMLLILVGLAALVVNSNTPALAAPAKAHLASVVSQACNPGASVDATADPTTVMPGQNITFTVRNFSPGERVSFWFTSPTGAVIGTSEPLCCAPNNGVLPFAPLRIPDSFAQQPGRWAFTVQGETSHHTSIAYFCVVTQVQPTAPPPTSTSAPPTATTAPPSATTVPSTSTTAPPTSTTEVATATTGVATGTAIVPTASVPAASPTTAVTTPTTAPTTQPTTVIETATTAPTEVVPQPTTIPAGTPTVVGMPRTGQGNSMPVAPILAIIAAAMFSTGWLIQRKVRVKR